MKKIGLICLTLVLALGTMGVGYAMWSETLVVTEMVTTGEVDFEFESGSFSSKDTNIDWTCDSTCDDPASITNIRPLDKNVGSTTGILSDTDNDGDLDSLQVTVDTAYPSYYNDVGFWVHNNGTVPIKIWKVVIDGHEFTSFPSIVCLDLDADGNADITVRWGDGWGAQLEPSGSVRLGFDFHILQAAPQDRQDLTFTITITAIQWNAYPL